MKYVPNGLSRFVGRSLLKMNANSPTIMVVAGVVGLGTTAVLAAKATRNIDPVLEKYQKERATIDETAYTRDRDRQKDLLHLYTMTGRDMAFLYGPTLVVGTISTASVLYGHKVLRGRHLATVAAYTGLMEQFQAYRGRIAKTLGEQAEIDIFNGAHGEWQEDPDHKGEYKLAPVYDETKTSYLRPWFDQTNINWNRDPVANYLFLKGVQGHMNNTLQTRGHVFLNDVFDSLRIPRCKEGAVVGWKYGNVKGDNYIDFGFMTGQDPQTIGFRNGVENLVQLNFNTDGIIWDQI